MYTPLRQFLDSCAQRYIENRGKNTEINYSPSNDFKELPKEEQYSIIQFINNFNSEFKNRYSFNKLPNDIQSQFIKEYNFNQDKINDFYNSLTPAKKIEKLHQYSNTGVVNDETKEEVFTLNATPEEYKIIESLHNVLNGQNDLSLTQEDTVLLEGTLPKIAPGASLSLTDHMSGNTVTLSNKNGECYINGNNITNINLKNGYVEIQYTIKGIADIFFKKLDDIIFDKFAANNLMHYNHMLIKGMLAKLTNFNSTNDCMFLNSIFQGQNSFLHYTAGTMVIQNLRTFIETIPESFRKEYLELKNDKGQTVADLVRNTPDKLQLVQRYLQNNNRTIIISEAQGTHSAPIHHSVNNSFLKLKKRFFSGETNSEVGYDQQTNNEIRDPTNISDSINEQLSNLYQELAIMMSWNDSQLLHNISQFLDESQKTLPISNIEIKRRLDFYRFQIEKAAELTAYFIDGHYTYFNVNEALPIGLSSKEMLALSYMSTKDLDNLIIGTKLNEFNQPVNKKYYEGTESEKSQFLNEIKWKFIRGLFEIIRGYNIERDEDKPYEFRYNDTAPNRPICIGGTANMLLGCINHIHEDIDIKTVNQSTLKLRILKDVPDIINNIIQESSDQEKHEIAYLLNEWQRSNIAPIGLINKIYPKFDLSNTENPLISDYTTSFTKNEIERYTMDGLEQLSYPHGKITELTSYINTLDSDDIGFIKRLDFLPKYTKDENGNPVITLIYELKKNPELMLELIKSDYPLKNYYFMEYSGYVVHVMEWWLANHVDLLEGNYDLTLKALDTLFYNTTRFRALNTFSLTFPKFFHSETFNIDALVTRAQTLSFRAVCRLILPHIPQEKFYLFFDHLIKLIPESESYEIEYFLQYLLNLLKTVPENQMSHLVNPLSELQEQMDITDILIKSVPATSIHLFKEIISNRLKERYYMPQFLKDASEAHIEALSDIISTAINKDSYYAAEIIKAIPQEKIDLLIPAISTAINEKSYYAAEIIKAIPQEKIDLLIPAISTAINKDSHYAAEIIKAIPQEKIDLLIPAISTAINEKSYYAAEIIKAIPQEKIDLLIPAISTAINEKSYYAAEIIKAIPQEKINLLIPATSTAMSTSELQAPEIIKAIPQEKIDFPIPATSTAMSTSELQAPEIIKAIPQEKIDFPIPATSTAMSKSELQATEIIKALPQEKINLLIPATSTAMSTSELQAPEIIKAIPQEKIDFPIPATSTAMSTSELQAPEIIKAIPDVIAEKLMEDNKLMKDKCKEVYTILQKVEKDGITEIVSSTCKILSNKNNGNTNVKDAISALLDVAMLVKNDIAFNKKIFANKQDIGR